ncbi:ATP-binding protein [Chitinibacter fontanus]|uniref:ATP-binding protein n=1 Tax=Chitinibacter fontanus TaxID=1737446 RepID=A0A7D5ZIP4_9NEIS|nr:ATP-binding protein [Chitinibacter fontanus]QLI82507.1 ATP-binding protein [Chitinibacter fontanus]
MNIHFVFGPQGAGKSAYAQQLANKLGGLYFSIDAWMQTLYGADLPTPLDLNWVLARVSRCENQIWAMVRQHVQLGGVAVLDLGLLKHRQRLHFQSLAAQCDCPVQWHFIDAPLAIRRQRVIERNQQRGETYAFTVTTTMFDVMEAQFERPDEQQLVDAIQITT